MKCVLRLIWIFISSFGGYFHLCLEFETFSLPPSISFNLANQQWSSIFYTSCSCTRKNNSMHMTLILYLYVLMKIKHVLHKIHEDRRYSGNCLLKLLFINFINIFLSFFTSFWFWFWSILIKKKMCVWIKLYHKMKLILVCINLQCWIYCFITELSVHLSCNFLLHVMQLQLQPLQRLHYLRHHQVQQIQMA